MLRHQQYASRTRGEIQILSVCSCKDVYASDQALSKHKWDGPFRDFETLGELEKKEKQRRSISDQWPPPSTLWRSSPSRVANLSGNEDASRVIWLYRNSGILFNNWKWLGWFIVFIKAFILSIYLSSRVCIHDMKHRHTMVFIAPGQPLRWVIRR